MHCTWINLIHIHNLRDGIQNNPLSLSLSCLYVLLGSLFLYSQNSWTDSSALHLSPLLRLPSVSSCDLYDLRVPLIFYYDDDDDGGDGAHDVAVLFDFLLSEILCLLLLSFHSLLSSSLSYQACPPAVYPHTCGGWNQPLTPPPAADETQRLGDRCPEPAGHPNL